MKELDELYEVLNIVKNDGLETAKSPIPIFSFEGLPGAGKTTQIELVSKALSKKYGKAYFIDLPTKSPIGKILKSLYSEEIKWNDVRKSAPWFNPIMISTDLRLAVNKAASEGNKYAIMSRGLLSTYYYNLDAYGKYESETWNLITEHLKGFYQPSVIIFMDIPPKLAHERVVKRNRGSLRKMDSIEEMKKDLKLFDDYSEKMPNIPVCHINAVGKKEEITQRIIDEIEGYIK